eukprot:IDg1797t1
MVLSCSGPYIGVDCDTCGVETVSRKQQQHKQQGKSPAQLEQQTEVMSKSVGAQRPLRETAESQEVVRSWASPRLARVGVAKVCRVVVDRSAGKIT